MKSPYPKLPVVAIVGRANVGKSTLFNRIIEKRKAIVQRESGTTRDRLYENTEWNGKTFRLVDTGGFEFKSPDTLTQKVAKEVQKALEEAHTILFVVDVEAGLTPVDETFADLLRKYDKKLILVINKIDIKDRLLKSSEFFRLGFSRTSTISATHGLGVGDLLDEVVGLLPAQSGASEPPPYQFTLTIVGEPNVGKSTYLNKLLEEERVIVSPIPGTTRDFIEEFLLFEGKRIRVVDTAGLRHNKKIKSATELFSFSRTREAISMADVVILLFDSHLGIRRDSKRVLDQILDEKKGLVLAANKWDLAGERKWNLYEKQFYQNVNYLTGYPLFAMSALSGKNILKPIQAAVGVYENYSRKFTTHELNEFLEKMKRAHPPQGGSLKYMVQIGAKPLRFSLFLKHKEKVPDNYWNFFKHQFIEHFKLTGVGIRLILTEEKEKT
ncbi:MAG: ribosome biogenesis GTPase Der [Candidatus Omnitrophica bacterium]|nr:ribosome biogenesis GTPase Der [Candidatus Omnitrophota bacterium]